MEREAVAKKPSRMKSVRQWLSLRVTQERTKTEAPAELLPNHEPSSQLEVDEGAARATPPETASNENAAASTETGKEDCKDSKDDGDERGSTTVAQLDNTGAKGESESESEENRPEDDKDDDDAVDKSARDFWKEAWESDELGEAKRALLQGRSGVGKSKDQKPSQANSIELVGLVIENTEAKMVNYKARWGSDNGETSLRNAKSILFSALTFKDLLDNVVKFDPTGYCSAAWAVVSFGLTLALHDKELADSTFKACSYLSHSMALYSRMESNYRERKAKQEKQLEDALVRVYTAILVYAAEVQESSNGRTRTRVKKFILSLAGQPLRDLETKINEEKSALEDWQNQVSRELADEAREEIMEIRTNTEVILKRVDGLAKTASDTYAKATAAELERLCEWLLKRDRGRQDKIRTSLATERGWWLNSGNSHWRPGGDGDRKGKKYHTASDTATDESGDDDDHQGSESGDITTDPETSEDEEAHDRKTLDVVSKTSLEQDADQADEYGDWLFESREYTEWVKYPQSLLWLYGNSGCGKSVLCSSIIRNLKKTFGNDPTKALASWYFRFDHEDTKRMHLLLASLLGQLTIKCKKVPDDGLYETLRDYQGQGQLPDDSMDLFNHLQRFISKADRDIFLVLDGLDHVLDRRGSRKNDIKLLDIILKLIQKEYTNLHVLVVSKYEKDIAQDFENKIRDMLVSVDVEQGLGKVLETFVERKLEDTPVLKGEDSLKGEVKQRLGHYQSSQGSNFHWARSILKQVSACHEPAEVTAELRKLPENIAARYQDALEKVAANSVKRLKDILLWLMNQKRPLSQAELAAVVKLRNAKEVAGICPRVLVETATENKVDVFRFTHFSVQEYLKDPFSRAPKGQETIRSGNIERLLPPQKHDAHLLITKRCLEILSAFRPTKTNKKKGDAIENTSSSDGDSDRLVSSAPGPNRRRVTIDASDHGSDAWRTQDTSPDDSAPDRRAPIKTASRKSIDVPARGYAAEFWFCHYNEIHSNEGQFNAIGSDKGFPARLKELESEICSKLLLDKEKMRAWLDTYDPDGRGNKKPPSAVYYAVKLELNGILTRLVEEISKLHTNLPARRRALDQRGLEGTALQLAAVRGESDIINLLLQQGADVNAEKGPHGTALYAAAAEGHLEVVKSLFQAMKLLHADTKTGDQADGNLGSPLHVAAFRGHDAVVKLLLEPPGVAVDHLADPFGTALQAACASRKISTIKLLLANDADPNIVAGCFGTAAQAAFAHPRVSLVKGSDEVLEMLRSKNAEWLESPMFWTLAYSRVRSSLDPRPRYNRMNVLDFASTNYETLLKASAPSWLEEEALGEHELLASVVHQWTIPMTTMPDEAFINRRLLARIPFQDQLDAIKRVVPHHENTMNHLRHQDFLSKARFWAGINYVLGRIRELISRCLDRVSRLLRRREHRDNTALSSFQWALPEFDEPWYGYGERYDPDPWFGWPRERAMYMKASSRRQRYMMRHPGDDDSDQVMMSPSTKNDAFAVTNSMARADAITMELTQQRQKQRRFEEMAQTPVSGGDADTEAVLPELRVTSQTGIWTVSDILELVKHLIEYGDRCARYQDAVTTVPAKGDIHEKPPEPPAKPVDLHNIEDLTFELFSTVIRLALALQDHGTTFEKLARPVQLLTTVRLERIKRLDALCERAFLSSSSTCKHTCESCNSKSNNNNAHVPTETNSDMDSQKVAVAVAQQVEQLIANKLDAAQSAIVQDFQSHVSAAVKEKVAHLVEEVERDIVQKIKDEVQRRLAEAQADQP